MCDRFKFRVWDEPNKKMIYDVVSDLRYYLSYDVFEVMQCTGLKDVNGKLIYEGDIVKINENYCDYSGIEDFYINQNFVVEYFQPRAVYLLKPFEYKDTDGSGIYDLSPDFYEFLKWKPCGKLEEYTLQGIEVIGNVFQDKELLNEKI
jgi:uncharacterized phage protein (TIGR01671 family)